MKKRVYSQEDYDYAVRRCEEARERRNNFLGLPSIRGRLEYLSVRVYRLKYYRVDDPAYTLETVSALITFNAGLVFVVVGMFALSL